MWLPIYMIHLDLTFNISHRAAKKSIFCLFVCFSKRYLYTSMAFLISTETKEQGPLQLAIYVVQNRHAGKQKSHWDKTNRANYFLKLIMCSFCLFNLVPRALFPGIGGGPHLQSQGKAALGRGCCLTCPSATFTLQRGSFVPREWLAAKGLLANS